jgi:hypothetical protein
MGGDVMPSVEICMTLASTAESSLNVFRALDGYSTLIY